MCLCTQLFRCHLHSNGWLQGIHNTLSVALVVHCDILLVVNILMSSSHLFRCPPFARLPSTSPPGWHVICVLCLLKWPTDFTCLFFFFKFLSSTVFVSSLSKVSVFYCVFVSIKYNRFFCLSTSSGPQYYFQLFVHCPCFCTKKYCWIYITFYDCQFQLIGCPSISQYSFHFVTYIFGHSYYLFYFHLTFAIIYYYMTKR